MADAREPRLPKWAQDELVSLRRQVEDLTAALSTARLEHATIVIESDLRAARGDVRLPEHTRIRFEFPTLYAGRRTSIGVHLRDEHDGRVLDVCGDGSIVLLPRSSNTVYIRPREHGGIR